MNTKDIQTAGGMQAKFKAGYLMKFVKGKVEWYFNEVNKPWYEKHEEEIENETNDLIYEK